MLLIVVFLFLIILLFKHSPHVENYAVKYKLNVENILELYKKNYVSSTNEGLINYANIF